MRKALCFTLMAGVAACGSPNRDQQASRRSETTTQTSSDLRTMDAAEEAPAPGAPPPPPSIGPSAAPGVAFNYRYGFRLPSQRISAVQEEHAQACEKLGLDRCRITGMRYRLVNETDVEAMLAFKLDPTIARTFGKAGVEAVQRAEGMLVESEITGEDAGADIAAATRGQATLDDDLKRIEAQLARKGLGSSERAELQVQAQQIREQIRSLQANKQEKRESLAKTPVVFNYGSGDLAPGFDREDGIKGALQQAGHNLVSGFATILLIAITLIPWVLLLALLFVAGRLIVPRVRRFIDGPQPAEAPAAD